MTPDRSATGSEPAGQRQRLDKYLWFARVVKTRTLAAKLVTGGNVRVNQARAVNPAKPVAPGDVLTIALDRSVRVLRVVAPGIRRGPYEEARLLYEEILEDRQPDAVAAPGEGNRQDALSRGLPEPARGRPEKRERRQAAALKRWGAEQD